jgi:hypothetical protein
MGISGTPMIQPLKSGNAGGISAAQMIFNASPSTGLMASRISSQKK